MAVCLLQQCRNCGGYSHTWLKPPETFSDLWLMPTCSMYSMQGTTDGDRFTCIQL